MSMSEPLNLSVKRSAKTKATIVIVDDDEILTQNIYKVLLEKAGYRVLTANNGISGLNLLKGEATSPAVVLVDCSMPTMDGETFLRELKAILPQIFYESKVIGFTSYDPRSSIFKKVKGLAYDCREKPLHIDEFLKIVRDYIGMPSHCAYA